MTAPSVVSSSKVDLFGHVLVETTRGLLRSGLDRGYVPRHEVSARIAGKLDIPGTLRVLDRGPPRVACAPDELTQDVLHNQLIRETLGSLARMELVSARVLESAHRLREELRDVSDVAVAPELFRMTQVQRRNWRYRFALQVCELLYRNTLIEPRTGRHRFHDFRGDEREMGALFEAFARNFWRRHLPALGVRSRKLQWPVQCDEVALQLLPEMRTDISFYGRGGEGVIECKCVADALQSRQGGRPKLRSAHLYQLFAYLNALRGEGHENAAGVLLYAVDAELPDVRLQHGRRAVRVASVNCRRKRLRVSRR